MPSKSAWNALLARARKGDATAQLDVADAYAAALDEKPAVAPARQSDTIAFKWYGKAAVNGNIEALKILADFVSEGRGCTQDIPRAIRLYLKAVDAGSAMAAYNLGVTYRDLGEQEQAFRYYQLAAVLEKQEHSFQTGLCHYYGIGTVLDRALACRIFEAVSNGTLGNQTGYDTDEANYLLGISYLNGDGVPASTDRAREFLHLANADGDHRSAEQVLHLIGWQKRSA